MTKQIEHPLASGIAKRLLRWWTAGHAQYPWRLTRDPYAIWVAEIMLQQTQIATAAPYYLRWMEQFPSVASLSQASLPELLKAWEGLGYYRRARNLHAAARVVADQYDGRVPNTFAGLLALPGVGRYTAGAIASIAFGEPVPALDGNGIRVLSRVIDLADDVTAAAGRNRLWGLAESLLPPDRPGDFNQALMELGQRVCLPAAPRCVDCPLRSLCLARRRGTQFERPVRPARARIPHLDVVAAIVWRGRPTPTAGFLIAQRPPDGMLGGLWEFPGGKVEEGETREQALRREIMEELGMEIEVGDHVVSVDHAYTHFRISLHAYHARHLRGRLRHLGVADHAWVTLAAVDAYPFAATDRKILAALRAALKKVPADAAARGRASASPQQASAILRPPTAAGTRFRRA